MSNHEPWCTGEHSTGPCPVPEVDLHGPEIGRVSSRKPNLKVGTMTGPQAAQLIAQKYALKLELVGLRHSKGSVYQHVKRLYGLRGSKASVYEQFAKLVDDAVMKRELPTKRAEEQTR